MELDWKGRIGHRIAVFRQEKRVKQTFVTLLTLYICADSTFIKNFDFDK